MAKAAEAHSSKINFDGELHQVFQSGAIVLATGAQSNKGTSVAPCTLEVVHAILNVIATPTSANAKLNIGNRGDSNAYLDGYALQNLATGVHIIPASSFAATAIPRGTVVEFETEAATAVGSIAVSLVLKPGSQV